MKHVICTILFVYLVLQLIGRNKVETYSADANVITGWTDNSYGTVEHGKNLSEQQCRDKAKAIGHLAFGLRNDKHPDPNYNNTCWTNSFVNSWTTDPIAVSRKDDKIHKQGCVDPLAKFGNQCRTDDMMWGALPGDIYTYKAADKDSVPGAKTVAECRQKAKEANKPGFLFRTPMHPDENFRNTCNLYETMPTVLKMSGDRNHMTFCTDTNGKISEKCAAANSGGGGACFSSSSTVDTPVGIKNIMNLKIGDQIYTPNGIESITSYLHRDETTKTKMIKVITNKNYIELTEDHMILVNDRYIRADEICIGDKIEKDNQVIKLENIESIGYCAPLTASGTLLVNGFNVSCYVQYGYMLSHEIIHAFMKNFAKSIDETNNEIQSPYVKQLQHVYDTIFVH